MFADSMLETSWAQHSRRSWTTLTSFGVQAVAIGLLLMVPLLGTVGIPLAKSLSMPISLGRPNPAPAQAFNQPHGGGVQIIPRTGRLLLPNWMPSTIPMGRDMPSEGPYASDGDPTGAIGIPGGDLSGIPMPMGGTRPVMPLPAAPTVRQFRTSSMLQGSLIRRVDPVYPQLARNARIQGPVVLDAFISKEGTMERLRLISGHPMLMPAALQAVSQWRYKPYILNGEAIEVETQITVNFVLAN